MQISVTPSKFIPTTPPLAAAITRKSMDEVWEHIILPSLHHPAAAVHSIYDGGMNLPDFLHDDSYPYGPHHHHQNNHDKVGGTGFPFGCRSPAPVLASAPSPATVLSFKSGHLDHFVETKQEYCAENPSFVSSSSCKKRVNPENNEDDAAAERRRKRLIKNRESAARSRARKQAYTDELEQEMGELKRENAKLRGEIEKSFAEEEEVAAPAPAPAPAPAAAQYLNSGTEQSLHRTLTAPF